MRELVVGASPENAPTPEQDLEARRNARERAGLPVLPGGATVASADSPPKPVSDDTGADVPKLVDVEVVAIYW